LDDALLLREHEQLRVGIVVHVARREVLQLGVTRIRITPLQALPRDLPVRDQGVRLRVGGDQVQLPVPVEIHDRHGARAVAGIGEAVYRDRRVAIARLLDGLLRELVEHDPLAGPFDDGEQRRVGAGGHDRLRLHEGGHLEADLRPERAVSLLPVARPQTHRRRVLGHDRHDVQAAVAVVVGDHERDKVLAHQQLQGMSQVVSVQRPDHDRAVSDGQQLRAPIADDIGDGETVAVGRQVPDAMLARDGVLARRLLAHEDELAGRSRVDEIQEAVAVEVVRDHRHDAVTDRQLPAAKPPMLRRLVDPWLHDRLRVVPGRVGPLLVQLDPAGVVVHHDQVEQSVSVHVGHGHRPRAAVDLDDLHRVEAEVP
jgi:hypothetical protein